MKCLIIAGDLGITAPGLVYETIIRELTKYAEISVIVPEKRKDLDLPVAYLESADRGFEHIRIAHAFMALCGISLFDEYWVLKQKRILDDNIIKQQDVIISLVSFHNYKGLILGDYLSTKYQKKWVVYSVDAIPAPLGWIKDGLFYRNTCRFVSNRISRCDAFFSSNEQMLHYQLQAMKVLPANIGVVYTPIRSDITIDSFSVTEYPLFLYTGGLYGPRKKEALLDGFRLLLNDYPKARLVFVGVNRIDFFEAYKDMLESGNLELHGYTHDLQKFYKSATALIDINAYFDNDVFLSSKIVNYLIVKKPIISITGLNSPSRNIFKEDISILHCKHNSNEIYQALKKVLEYDFDDWSERKKYIDMFSVENVVKNIVKVLVKI